VYRPKLLEAFSAEEAQRAYELLSRKVAYMGLRKFEEGDWAEVYTAVKGIPPVGWSNLALDVMYQGLGVEHKMLCTGARWPADLRGTRLMHPAATRSIRVPGPTTEAEEAKRKVLSQYADLILQRKQSVALTSDEGEADMRTGWLLWKRDLRQFLYFEEELVPPDPADFTAVWRVHDRRGIRKPSTNLWIYEKDPGPDGDLIKRFSVTGGDAGAKIQPYFDVPPSSAPHVYVFTTQGEALDDGTVRTWVTEETATALAGVTDGDTSVENLSSLIEDLTERLAETDPDELEVEAHEIVISGRAARALSEALPNMTDDERFKMLVRLCIHPGD
jgi:hypothetical protein